MKNKKLIVGFHATNARLWQNPKSLYEIYVLNSKDDQRTRDVIKKAHQENIRVYWVEADRLQAIAGKHTKHNGIVAFIDASSPFTHIDDILDQLQEPPFLLILDGITDPHNLGAILRVADAMGVHAVIAPKDKSAGLNTTVSKIACGAAESIHYITVTNLVRTIKELKKRQIWIYGTDTNTDVNLYEANLPLGIAWIVGSEGAGMRRLTKENCDVLISIPMYGTVESLNVSVSTGIILSETKRQHFLKLKGV
ncbi:MAG: 23S rRNA (guanosine(2251)-2'-O)-methyltransferase RlmB [Neisseriaceae bacterium]|nr:MAG: 23S rRNA (guanosine(2251)-2'-O)-methyltransferase RlmB [Neisseriaceae bacterium]